MANRQITRRIAISAVISILLIFFLFIRPQGPPSPAIRAPGHITHNAASPGIIIQEETLKGDIVMPKLGNATAKYVARVVAAIHHNVLEEDSMDKSLTRHLQGRTRSRDLEVLPHGHGQIS